LPARRFRVEVVRDGRDGAPLEIELPARVTAGREQKLRASQGRMTLTVVELDLRARDEAERRKTIQRLGAFQRPKRRADWVLGGYDAARTAATTCSSSPAAIRSASRRSDPLLRPRPARIVSTS
jgi:hypothetical protein